MMRSKFDGFSVNLFLDEDGDWLAHLVELPEISAFANTPIEALEELATAWEATKESLLEHDESVPVAPAREESHGKWELKDYQALTYSRRVEGIYKDDGSFYWVSWIDELPECQAIGGTYAEVMQNLNIEFDNYIEILLKSGANIPVPKREGIHLVKEEIPTDVNPTKTVGQPQEGVVLKSSSSKIKNIGEETMRTHESSSVRMDFIAA